MKYRIISIFFFLIQWKRYCLTEQESQHPGSSLSGRSIGRSVERHTVPACFLLCNFRANINTLRSAIALHSRLGFVYWCLYILRKQTNQYQSLKFSWLRVTFHFKWNGRLLLVIKKKKRERNLSRNTKKQTSMRSVNSFFNSSFDWKNLGKTVNGCLEIG